MHKLLRHAIVELWDCEMGYSAEKFSKF